MSQLLIQQYLNQLQDLRKVGGTHGESVVREAFKDLLKDWARAHDLIFVPEYEIVAPTKERRYVDGALLHARAPSKASKLPSPILARSQQLHQKARPNSNRNASLRELSHRVSTGGRTTGHRQVLVFAGSPSNSVTDGTSNIAITLSVGRRGRT